MTIATGDSVSIEYTGRLEDGTVFDTSRESVAEETELADEQPEREFTPLTVEVGAGQVIDGLEDALIGMEPGDTPTVKIPPEKGYGEWSEERVRTFDPAELSQQLGDEQPEEGMFLQTQDGNLAEITEVTDEVIRVDFNPQLAGETLEFDIEVVSVAN